MRDYVFERIALRPVVSLDPVPHDELPALVEQIVGTFRSRGLREDQFMEPRLQVAGAPSLPRAVALMVIKKAVRRVGLADGAVLASDAELGGWIDRLPDDAALHLFRECVTRAN